MALNTAIATAHKIINTIINIAIALVLSILQPPAANLEISPTVSASISISSLVL